MATNEDIPIDESADSGDSELGLEPLDGGVTEDSAPDDNSLSLLGDANMFSLEDGIDLMGKSGLPLKLEDSAGGLTLDNSIAGLSGSLAGLSDSTFPDEGLAGDDTSVNLNTDTAAGIQPVGDGILNMENEAITIPTDGVISEAKDTDTTLEVKDTDTTAVQKKAPLAKSKGKKSKKGKKETRKRGTVSVGTINVLYSFVLVIAALLCVTILFVHMEVAYAPILLESVPFADGWVLKGLCYFLLAVTGIFFLALERKMAIIHFEPVRGVEYEDVNLFEFGIDYLCCQLKSLFIDLPAQIIKEMKFYEFLYLLWSMPFAAVLLWLIYSLTVNVEPFGFQEMLPHPFKHEGSAPMMGIGLLCLPLFAIFWYHNCCDLIENPRPVLEKVVGGKDKKDKKKKKKKASKKKK